MDEHCVMNLVGFLYFTSAPYIFSSIFKCPWALNLNRNLPSLFGKQMVPTLLVLQITLEGYSLPGSYKSSGLLPNPRAPCGLWSVSTTDPPNLPCGWVYYAAVYTYEIIGFAMATTIIGDFMKKVRISISWRIRHVNQCQCTRLVLQTFLIMSMVMTSHVNISCTGAPTYFNELCWCSYGFFAIIQLGLRIECIPYGCENEMP